MSVAAPGERDGRALLKAGYAVYSVSMLLPAAPDLVGVVAALYFYPAYWLNIALVLMALPFWLHRRSGDLVWWYLGFLLSLGALGHQLFIGIQTVLHDGWGGVGIGYYAWCSAPVLFAGAFWEARAHETAVRSIARARRRRWAEERRREPE